MQSSPAPVPLGHSIPHNLRSCLRSPPQNIPQADHTECAHTHQVFNPSMRKPGWKSSEMGCRPERPRRIATWNVEGVGASYPSKLEQITAHMRVHGINITALQETYVKDSPWFSTDDGYLVNLSGGSAQRERAGVGFVIAPCVKHAIIGFKQATARIATLKLRSYGGCICIIAACPF